MRSITQLCALCALCVLCKVTFWWVSDTWQLGRAGMGWDLVEWEGS